METNSSNPNVTTLYPTNKSIIRHHNETKQPKRPSSQTWKLEATFAASNLTEVEAKNNSMSKEKKEEEIKKTISNFKPSQHLGSFFDDDAAEVIKTPISGPGIKRPASGFVSSFQDEVPSTNTIPKEFYERYHPLPYNYEDTIFAKARPNWQDDPVDSQPTVEVPVKLPAGGLYQSPLTLKEKPNNNEELDLVINEEPKEHGLKKRGNPWQDILRIMTAFIPVGLIISALTPSVITIHNVDDNRDPVRQGMFRRSDTGAAGAAGAAGLAPISERCRRRLLCELHSDVHYTSSSSPSRRKAKHCYKIHCEDTDALWRMLRWLLTYKQQAHDQRERRFT